MELNHLKYFYYVAKEGGFTKASKALKIAQPAITKTVKTLEASLGVELFTRSGREVRLTKIGNDIYRKCELIFGHVAEIQSIHKTAPLVVGGALNMAVAEPIASQVIPKILKSLMATYPDIYPQVTTTTAAESLRLVVAEKVEFAILFHAPDLPDSLEVRAAIPVTHKLVVANDKRTSVKTCSSFLGSREVDDIGNKNYPTLSKLRKKYPHAEVKISTNSLSAHRQMVLDGLGVAILPEFMVREDIKAKRLACLLTDEDFRFSMKLICRRAGQLSRAAEEFMKLWSQTTHSL